MKVIIIGAGFTGVQLARALVAEGNDVALIDKDDGRVRNARNKLDCTVVQAEGNSLKTLEDAGLPSADAVVALTEDDEVNMVICALVAPSYPDVLKIARVRNDACYAGAMTGVDSMIHPDVEAAAAICRAMNHGAVGNVVPIGGGFGIASVPVVECGALAGVPLWTLASLPGWRYLVAYVESGKEAFLPGGDTVLSPGDRAGVLASYADMPALMKLVDGSADATPRRVAVFGAGRIGSLVVERLLAGRQTSFFGALFGGGAKGREITLVDGDEGLCRAASQRFRGVRVLCGEITDTDFIRDEGLDTYDLMVAASGSYERNLVIASYLKSRGVAKTIALTESAEFDDVARKLGVDVAVPMRGTVVDSVMSHLRGGGVTAVHTVCNGRFEVVECDVAQDSKVVGRALKDISRRGEYLLLLRSAGGKDLAMPNGDTVISAGDHVVLVLRAGDAEIVRLFGGGA